MTIPSTVASIGDSLICLIPERPESLRYSERLIRKIAGAEINTLIGLSRLGVKTRYFTELNEGELGNTIEHYLTGEKIQLVAKRTVLPTPLFIKQTMLDGSVRVDYYRSRTAGSEMRSLALSAEDFADVGIFFFTGIFPALSQANDELLTGLLEKYKGAGRLIAFDPNIRYKLFSDRSSIPSFMKKFICFCGLLFISETEAMAIFGTDEPDQIYAEVQKLGVRHLVVKQGEKGSIVYEDGQKTQILPISPRRVLDTCGAGDAYNAGYLYALLQGKSAAEKGLVGSLLAAQIIQSHSDNENYPYADELPKLLESMSRASSGIPESVR